MANVQSVKVPPAKQRVIIRGWVIRAVVGLFPTPTLVNVIGDATSDKLIASMKQLLLTLQEYAWDTLRYQAKLPLSMASTPPPVVVKSYLVAIVAFGITFAVLAAVVLFSKKMFGTTTRNPETGT